MGRDHRRAHRGDGCFDQNLRWPGFAKQWGLELSVAMILIIGLGLHAMFKRKDWL